MVSYWYENRRELFLRASQGVGRCSFILFSSVQFDSEKNDVSRIGRVFQKKYNYASYPGLYLYYSPHNPGLHSAGLAGLKPVSRRYCDKYRMFPLFCFSTFTLCNLLTISQVKPIQIGASDCLAKSFYVVFLRL